MKASAGRSTKAIYLAAAFLLAGDARFLFSDLREQMVEQINGARSSIDVVVYEIGSSDIADALVMAKRRGVRVRVIVDSVHSPSATSQEKALEDEGIAVKRIGGGSGRKLMHDKFILFDGSLASTPSYNRSVKSLRGADNDEAFTSDKTLIQKLKSQFDEFWNSTGQNEISQN
jgi:phosphatidylserine/phosphatidylglycerophosphate/cardiolipin synthase-like enzyme